MKNSDGPSPEPENYADAMNLSLDWAVGRRSHWNEIHPTMRQDGSDPVLGTALCVLADAAEATKWATIAQAMAHEYQTNPARLSVDVDRLRRSIAGVNQAYKALTTEQLEAIERWSDYFSKKKTEGDR